MSGRRICPGLLQLMATAHGAPYAMREGLCCYAMRTDVEQCSTLNALCKAILMRGTGAVTTAGSWQGNGRQEELDGSAGALMDRVTAGSDSESGRSSTSEEEGEDPQDSGPSDQDDARDDKETADDKF